MINVGRISEYGNDRRGKFYIKIRLDTRQNLFTANKNCITDREMSMWNIILGINREIVMLYFDEDCRPVLKNSRVQFCVPLVGDASVYMVFKDGNAYLVEGTANKKRFWDCKRNKGGSEPPYKDAVVNKPDLPCKKNKKKFNKISKFLIKF